MALAYDFDGFRLDVPGRHLSYRGSRIKLTAKAVAVLALLAERAPEVVSRAEFEAVVWPEGFIEPANLTQTIYMLRKALGRHATLPPIETVNGRGYRLAATVVPGSVPAAASHAPAIEPSHRFGWPIAATLAAVVLALVMLVGAERTAADRSAADRQAGTPSGSTTHPQAAPAQRL
jgi:DNA-binding winged helix-turn-helix (wHTH) protein